MGGFLAAALERAGTPVTVVAREETAALIARDGIALDSVLLGRLTARPRAVALLEEPVDFLIVAAKATSLGAALERVVVEPGLVVPLLNGLDHLAVLRARFGAARVVAGTIRIEADRPAPGRVTQTSPFLRVDLASAHPSAHAALERLAASLRAAEVGVALSSSEPAVMWGKLVRLNALACTTSALDRPIGRIRADPQWRARLQGCVREGAAVARAEGAAIEADRVMAELDAVHDTLGSSMQRDIAAGRAPELDAIAGAVLRAGARHDIACPNVDELARRIARRAGVAAPSA